MLVSASFQRRVARVARFARLPLDLHASLPSWQTRGRDHGGPDPFYQWTRLGNKVRKHRGFWTARRHRSVWCVSSILCLDVIVKSLEKRRKRKVDHISACSDKLSKKMRHQKSNRALAGPIATSSQRPCSNVTLPGLFVVPPFLSNQQLFILIPSISSIHPLKATPDAG